MSSEPFLSKFRSFFGLYPRAPTNDFRNPIWGSDDDEDDDDELYSREHSRMDLPDITSQLRHMHEIFQSIEGMFGDFKSFFNQDQFGAFTSVNDYSTMIPNTTEPDATDNNSIRNYYLKPGFLHSQQHDTVEDKDLDGELSSQDVLSLLKKKNQGPSVTTITPFDANKVPGGMYCRTIITTSVRNPDGSIETRKIVKNGNEVVEETTTTSGPDPRNPQSGLSLVTSPSIILSDFTSLFKNFY